MKDKNAIIIFTKNPEKGKVKTRLAASIGDDAALNIYKILLHHTANITKKIKADRYAFYADEIGGDEFFHQYFFNKEIQEGNDLGEKMYNAFSVLINKKKYQKVVIVGGDCYELTSQIIEQAFSLLENHDGVIGPAKDGGYYLLGLKEPYSALFLNKTWSTESVCDEAINTFISLNKTYSLLPILSDVDYEEDLGDLRKFL